MTIKASSNASFPIPPVLRIVSLVVFAQTLFTRAVEPVIPMIATDLGVDLQTGALLTTAFAFPYALVQPGLGVAADFLGKTRLMNLSLLVVAVTALVCAMATTFSLIVAMRIAGGLLAGGVFPVAMALTADLVPVNQRQVAIGRLLAVGLTGNLLGSSIAGVIGDLAGWRAVFAMLGLFGLVVAVVAFFAFRGVTSPPPPPFNRAAVLANFRSIFADPRAKVCFSSVFLEAIFIHGLFPYVALLLLLIGETRASVAGFLIAAFSMGGVFYSLSVPILVTRFAERRLMIAGGALAAAGLVLVALQFPWMWQVAIYCRVRLRVLSSARLHPGARNGAVADRARGGGIAALVLLLHGPGGRPGGVRLRLRPRRAATEHSRRGRGRAGGRADLRTSAASPDDVTLWSPPAGRPRGSRWRSARAPQPSTPRANCPRGYCDGSLCSTSRLHHTKYAPSANPRATLKS